MKTEVIKKRIPNNSSMIDSFLFIWPTVMQLTDFATDRTRDN